jgi:hypothetical protein
MGDVLASKHNLSIVGPASFIHSGRISPAIPTTDVTLFHSRKKFG